MTVLEKAHELGKMIAECDEFIKFRTADEAQKADGEAQVLLLAYNRKRTQLMQKAQKEDITPDDMMEIKKELEAEYEKLKKNQNIVNYIEAAEAFNKLMGQVNAAVTNYVNPSQESGCSGDCGRVQHGNHRRK